MFARTERLTLRPGWIEDAPALAAAIGHEAVVRNLSRAPWPYRLADAEAAIAGGFTTPGPTFLIFAHDRAGCPLIGGIGIGPFDAKPNNLGYWLTPAVWGHGYIAEAGRAVLDIARTLGIQRVGSGHFVDNPASGRVLRRLGFVTTDMTTPVPSLARGQAVDSIEYAIDLSERRIHRPLAA